MDASCEALATKPLKTSVYIFMAREKTTAETAKEHKNKCKFQIQNIYYNKVKSYKMRDVI